MRPDEAREMCRLYVEDDLTIDEVARRVGRGFGTVHKHLRAAGVEIAPQCINRRPRQNHVPHSEMARTVELYESGLSMPQVARELGLSPGGVRRRLEYAGVPRRLRPEVGRMVGHTHPARMDQEIERCLVVLYELGVPVAEISRWLAVPSSTITRVVRRNGVPFRRPWKKRAAVDERQASKIDNTRLREAFIASDVPVSEVAFRCGWEKGDGSADTSRVQRALGLRPDVSRGRAISRKLVRSDIAALIAEAFGADPWEVGA